MKHIFRKGTDLAAPVLVLLHGTGGTEHDLLPVASVVSPRSAVLGVRGNVLENGMPRFFRRLREGVFDEEDLVLRTKELREFLDLAAERYDLDRGNFVAIGYSNGANMAGSLLFHYKNVLRGAILHHPMVPRRGVDIPDLTGIPVFIGAGENDSICAPRETEELASLLSAAGAEVTVHWEPGGHRLTKIEVDRAADWFRQHFGRE